MNITRTTNPNGTYRYEIDGEVHTKASKVLYTHVSTWTVGGPEFVTFHKTAATAAKAPGSPRNGWVKTGVIEIVDADAPATFDAVTEDHPAIVAAMGRKRARKAAAEDAAEVTADDIEFAREVTRATFATPAAEVPAEVAAERADRMGRAARIDADVERITARKTPAKTPAKGGEYVRTYLYAVEANGSGIAYPVRAATMHDAIRTVHTESRRPVIVDGLTPDRGYTTNVDDAGAWHFIVDDVNAYTVRRLETPAEGATVRVRRRADGETGTLREITRDGWVVDMDHGTDALGTRRAWALVSATEPAAPAKPAAPGYRRGTAVEYRAPGQNTWRPAVVESVRASDNAVMVKRPNGARDAAPARDVRLAPAEAASYLAGRHLARR